MSGVLTLPSPSIPYPDLPAPSQRARQRSAVHAPGQYRQGDDYDERLSEVADLIDRQKSKISQLRIMVRERQAAKTVKQRGMGVDFPEAFSDWDYAVGGAIEEDLDSEEFDDDIMAGEDMDEECLMDAIEACEALHNLQRRLVLDREAGMVGASQTTAYVE